MAGYLITRKPPDLKNGVLFSCCFNTNMISLQNFEYFEYKHIVLKKKLAPSAPDSFH